MWKASSWQTHLNKPLQPVIQRACANIFSTTCAVPTGCQHGRALAAQARCPGFGSLKWTHFSLTCAPHIKDCGGRGGGGGGGGGGWGGCMSAWRSSVEWQNWIELHLGEHWLHNPGVFGLVSGVWWSFHFSLYISTSKHLCCHRFQQ